LLMVVKITLVNSFVKAYFIKFFTFVSHKSVIRKYHPKGNNRKFGKQFIEGKINPNTGLEFDYTIPDWEISGREINNCAHYPESLTGNIYDIGQINSHWFYQIINGATGGGSGLCQNIDVEPLSQNEDLAWEIAEKIVWRSFSKKLFGPVDFNDARQGSIEATKELYPDDYCILKTVINAWYNVGIGGNFEEYIQSENLNLNPYPVTETIHNSYTSPWDNGDYYVDGIIRVTGNWNITNANVYFENRNSGIIIEQGGKLTITNSNLLTSGCNSDMWRGIQLLGDPSIQHPSINFNAAFSYPEFSVLIMSGSKIEDALIGIRASYTGTFNGSPGPPDGEWGSGIIYLENNDFVNNRQGIRMAWHTQNPGDGNLNKIDDCRFLNNKPLPNYDLDYDSQFRELATFQSDIRQIDLGGAQNVKVTDCNFTGVGIGLDYSQPSQQVTGIYCSYCSGSIGDESNISQNKNEFHTLYKGISIFGFESGQALNSFGNTFYYTNKGITLNTAPLTTIQQNEFNSIPFGTTDDDSYGILVYHSRGCDINNNHFNTAFDNNDHLRGIVLVNTNNTLVDIPDPMNITANVFSSLGASSGKFKSAIEFEGDNQNCQLQCNIFENDNAADWRFVSNGTQPTLLDEQGQEPITGQQEDPQKAFSTTWFRNSNGSSRTGYDISIDKYGNSTSEQIILRPDTENSKPIRVFNDGQLNDDEGYTGVDPFDCESLIEGIIDDPPPPSTNCITHRYEMKNYARQPLYAEYMLEYLECHNVAWADMTLVGTYVGTHQLIKARTTLEDIPLDSEENRAFYETYDEALTYLEGGQSAGKAAVAMQTLKDIAGPADPRKRAGKRSATAESFLAAMNGTNFTRSALSGKKEAVQSTTLSSAASLILFPNPANEVVSIIINNQLVKNGMLEIYNLQGKLLKSIRLDVANNTINVQELDAGMYICRYNNDTGKQFSSKLIINK